LEKLLDEFIAERMDLKKIDMTTKHAFDKLMHDRSAQIAQTT